MVKACSRGGALSLNFAASGTRHQDDGCKKMHRNCLRSRATIPKVVRRRTAPGKLARFRKIDPELDHDALDFADGTLVLVTHLLPGQHATGLQLPIVSDPRESNTSAEYRLIERAPL